MSGQDGNLGWRFNFNASVKGKKGPDSKRKDVHNIPFERRCHENFVTSRKVPTREDIGFSQDVLEAMEFVPELPAPTSKRPHANPFGAFSASARTGDPTDPNYFSDAESERTQSVAEEYREAERAEQAAAGIQEPSEKQTVDRKASQAVSSFHTKLRQAALKMAANQMAARGRGRRPGGSGMLKGATWEHDASIKLESKPTDLFPPHPNLKKPKPLTDKEKRQIGHYKRLQKEIHKGPLYTQPTKRDANAPAKTFSEDDFNRQYNTNPKANFDPFTGVETYSQRFQPKKNEIPKLAGRPFNKALFPKELWPALEGDAGEEVRKHLDRAHEKKAALMEAMRDKGKKPDDRTKIVLEKISSVVPGDEDGEEVEEEQEEDQEVDSNFDDESMGGDYDAEQYFDNGEDNSEGEGGGGDDNYD